MPDRPKKPTIPLCTVYAPKGETPKCICGVARGEEIKSVDELSHKVKNLMASPEAVIRPIHECHKYVMTSPKGWEKLENFMDSAVEYMKHYCGRDSGPR